MSNFNEMAEATKVETITKRESRERAKQESSYGMAWECPCGWWNPYELEEDQTRPPSPRNGRRPMICTYICRYCGK